MNTFEHVLSYILIFAIGIWIGDFISRYRIDEHNITVGKFYQNQAKKQAAQIEKIRDRLIYLTIGDLEDFIEYMKDDSEDGYGADDDYPVLAIKMPLEEPNFDLEDE